MTSTPTILNTNKKCWKKLDRMDVNGSFTYALLKFLTNPISQLNML